MLTDNQIKDSTQHERNLCNFCFTTNHRFLKCSGSCQKLFCKDCFKLFQNNGVCHFCKGLLQGEFIQLKNAPIYIASQIRKPCYDNDHYNRQKRRNTLYYSRYTSESANYPFTFPTHFCNSCKPILRSKYVCQIGHALFIGKGKEGSITNSACALCEIYIKNLRNKKTYIDPVCHLVICEGCKSSISKNQQEPLPSQIREQKKRVIQERNSYK